MKKLLAFIAVLFTGLTAFGQQHYSKFTFDTKFKKAPYSFLWVEQGKLGIKQSEVSVDEYLGFLEAVTRDSSFKYVMSMKPSRQCELFPYMDTSNTLVSVDEEDPGYRPISWLDEEKMKKDAMDKALLKKVDYESHFKPYKMPVTGISYEQALEYAKWCTIVANMESYKKVKDKSTIKQLVVYRLPTPAEFEALLKKNMEACDDKDPQKCADYLKWVKACHNQKGCALCNCAGKDTCAENKLANSIFGMEALHPIYSYNPGWIGVYNMQGNASEMTSEKGKAMGGSYKQPASECQPGSIQTYTRPEHWLGIRLIAEVVNLEGSNYYFDDEGELKVK